MSLDVLYVSVGPRFGPEQVAINLLKNILNLQSCVVYGVVDSNVAEALSLENQKYLRTVNNPLKLAIILLIISLKKRPKICHFNFPPLRFFYIPLLLLMKMLGIKIVYSFHGGILFEKHSAILRAFFLISCKYFYDLIIANSRYSERILLQTEKSLKRKVIILPNGINVSDWSKSTKIAITGQPFVLYVGRIDYIKGVDILVKAVALVKETLPKICLHIVGTGTKLEKIKELISSLRIEENVILHDFVNEKEKNRLYLACDMVVVPSRNEPFGIIVLEAMRAGKPLIVSNRGALPELVKHNYNGLVAELNPAALAAAILKLASDKALMTLMSETNQKTAELYDWKKISRKYITAYMTLADNCFDHNKLPVGV